jgi:hypothetical protein
MPFLFQNGGNNGPLLLKKKAMLQQEKGEQQFLPGSIKSVTIYRFHTMQ